MAVLPTPRLADEDRIVFRLSAENPDNPPDFRITADDRVEFLVPGVLDKIAPVFLEGLISGFRGSAGYPLASANRGERL